jgi:hypothetical protein
MQDMIGDLTPEFNAGTGPLNGQDPNPEDDTEEYAYIHSPKRSFFKRLFPPYTSPDQITVSLTP